MKNYPILLGAGLLAASCAPENLEHPNIVLINLDDSGNGDFSFKGAIGYETPHVDKLDTWPYFFLRPDNRIHA